MNYFHLAYKGNNKMALYVVGFLLICFGYILGQLPLTLVQAFQIRKYPEIGSAVLKEFESTLNFGLLHLSTNAGFVLLIMIFVIATLFLLIALKLHNKKLIDLITPSEKIDFKKVIFGALLWFGLSVLFEVIMYFIHPEQYVFRFQWSNFILLVIICLLLLPIQTSFEEFVFRGYLMQGISLIFKNKWIPLMITSILFSMVHSANPEVEKFGFFTMQFYYIGAGLFLGLLLIWDDGLELSLGVHAATNIYGASIVTYEGSVLQTDSLFATNTINPWLMIFVFYLGAIIFVYICIKKYKWTNLWSKIIMPIESASSNLSTINKIDILDDQVLITKVTNNDSKTDIPWDKININDNQ